ncbi:hypothetical protein [Methylorubrum zatmanii]
MARNLDILVGLVVQGWERGALNAEEVVRTMQRVELAPNVACGVNSADKPVSVETGVPFAVTAGEPGEFVFGGSTNADQKPAKPE